MAKKVTIHDVARESNVSIGTVYRAVNNSRRIKEETRKRVLETVERLGYKANTVARGLALRKNFKVLVIMPRFPEVFWNDVRAGVRAADAELSEFGVEIIGFYHENGRCGTKSVMDVLSEQNVDAISMSIVDLDDNDKVLIYAAENKIPVAVFNEETTSLGRLFYYGPDNRLAGQLAAELAAKFCCRGNAVCVVSYTGKRAGNETAAIRAGSFEKHLLKNYPDIRFAGSYRCEPGETNLLIQQMIQEQPEIRGVYFVEYEQLQKNYQMLANLENKYTVIGHEFCEEYRSALRDGTITALLVQEKECQGYFPIRILYDYLVTGEKPGQDKYFSNINIIIEANMDCLSKNDKGCGYS